MEYIKIVALLFVPLSTLSFGFTQQVSHVDSLKSALTVAPNAKDSAMILCNLIWSDWSNNEQEAKKYGYLALEKALQQTDSSTIAHAYDAAALAYKLDGRIQTAEELYRKSLNLGIKNNIPIRIAWGYYNLASIAKMKNKMEEAEPYVYQSAVNFRKINDYRMAFNSYWLIINASQHNYIDTLTTFILECIPEIENESKKIFYYLELTDLFTLKEDRNQAMYYVQLAVELAERNQNTKGVIKAYFRIAHYFREIQQNYPMALTYLKKAFELSPESVKKKNGNLYIELGETYRLSGNDSLALIYFNKALEIGTTTNHKHTKASAYRKLGDINYQNKLLKDALYYYTKCYETGCDVCPQIRFHDALLNIGNVYLHLGDNKKALLYYQKSLALADSATDKKALVKSFQAIASLYEKEGKAQLAIKYYLRSYKISQTIDYLEGQQHSASELSNIYLSQNNYQKAFLYLNVANVMSDSISRINEADNLARLETYFDFKNLQTERELERIKSNEELIRQKLIRNFFIIGFILLILSGSFLYISYRRKKRDNKLLKKQKLAIAEMSEKVHEADQAKLQFYTNISHEFKTPLTIILGVTEKLKVIVAESKPIDTIRRNSIKLLQLINHLLDLRKIDTLKMKLFVKEGNINEFLKGLISSFENIADQKKIQIEFLEKETQIIGFFDHNKLEKIISNLLSNALKYTQNNGKVKIILLEFEKNRISIEVSDNGIGIPENEIKNIFNRFYRISENNNEGSGIGLALVKELVDLHKGEIKVSGGNNKGLSITVYLPIGLQFYTHNEINNDNTESTAWNYIEAIDMEKDISLPEKDSEPNPDRKTILIIEDNLDLRKYISEMFVEDYEVLEAANGEKGYNMAKEFVPDIIISDIMMPKLSGIQLVDKIKNDNTTCHIPIILLTAKTDLETQLSSFKKGADEYISKPFDSNILKSRVENLLRLRKLLVDKFSKQFHLQPRDIQIEDADQKFLQKAIDIIESNISNPNLNVDLLALELGVSRTQLYRKINALTDYPPKNFIRIIRLKRAAQILQAGQNNIAEVMDATGFSNYSYFNNCFKEYYGELPKDYALVNVKGNLN